MDFSTLIVVGLCVGVLAGRFLGGCGYGPLSDAAIGIAGALLGSWLLVALGVGASFSTGGTIGVGFSGAAVTLLLMRLRRDARRTRDLWTRAPSNSAPWRL